jgi:hypothetical protein
MPAELKLVHAVGLGMMTITIILLRRPPFIGLPSPERTLRPFIPLERSS